MTNNELYWSGLTHHRHKFKQICSPTATATLTDEKMSLSQCMLTRKRGSFNSKLGSTPVHASRIAHAQVLIGASVSEPHTSLLNCDFSLHTRGM